MGAVGATAEDSSTNSRGVVTGGTATFVSLDTVGVGVTKHYADTTLEGTASSIRVERRRTAVTLRVGALLTDINETLTSTSRSTVSRPANTRDSWVLTATTGEALWTVGVTLTGLGTDLLGHTVATCRDLSCGTGVSTGAIAGLATSHTLGLLAGLEAGESLGVTLVLLRVGAVCIFETSHTAVVCHITSTAFAVCVGQTSYTLRSLGVAHLATGAVGVLTTACHTRFGAVADEASAAVGILVTTDTTLRSCVTHTADCVVEGSTIRVLRTTTGVGRGVTRGSLSSRSTSVKGATVVAAQALDTGRWAWAGLAYLSGVAESATIGVAATGQRTLTTCADLTIGAVAIGATTGFTHFRGGITDVTQCTVGVGAATITALTRIANLRGAVGVRRIPVCGGAVSVCGAVHTLVGGTLEAPGAMLGSISTLETLAAAGLTCRGWSLALCIAGTLGGDTLVALALLTSLTVAVGVTLHTLLGGSVTFQRRTIGVLGATRSNTYVGFASLESLTVAVFSASHTLVLSTDRFGRSGAVAISTTLAGLGHTRVGSDVTKLPSSTVAVDNTSVASSAAQLTALLVGILGAVTITLATGLRHTPVLYTEGLGCIFAIGVGLTLRSGRHALTVGITLGSGLFALGVRLTLRRCFNAGAVVTNRLGWIELLAVIIVLATGC